jgi:hypothetical protein
MVFSNSQWFTAPSSDDLVSVGNSALFQQANSEYLSKTPGSAGNRKLWTYSIWFYKVDPVVPLAQQFLHGYVSAGNGGTTIAINADDEFYMQSDGSFDAQTTAIFRDIGWYHIVFGMDAANTTCSIEVNGVAQVLTGTLPSNIDYAINNNTLQAIGRYSGGGSATNYLDGYQAETVFIDGTLYTATDFGEFDSTGLYWTPKSSDEIKALTFGTNGFYLDNTTNAETDASGNGNNWTNNNTVTTTSTNTPTNSQNLFSPLWPSATSTVTFSNGNKTFAATGGNTATCNRIGVSLPFPGSGKWIMGVSQLAVNDTGKSFGVWTDLDNKIGFPPESGAKYGGWYVSSVTNLYDDAGGYIINLTGNEAADQFWMAVDVDAGKSFAGYWDNSASTITWYAQDAGTDGNPATGDNPLDTGLSLEGKFFACCSLNSKPLTIVEEADIPFTVPSGYNFLSTTNIAAETTRTAADTTKYFDTILYEGNGAGQRVGQFQPFGNAFTVANGALFPTSDGNLSKTFGSAGNQKTWTFSTWFKKSINGVTLNIFRTSHGNDTALQFASDLLQFYLWDGSSYLCNLTTTQSFKDTSQWIHVSVKYDSTASTPSASGIAIYINGVQVTALNTSVYPSQNVDSGWNGNGAQTIGIEGTSNDFNGYMAETVFIDGLALAASSFGQTDTSTNRWIPKDVTGLTYGTNGFYLNYAASGSDLGDDAENSNDWTNNNSVVQVTDSPTSNRVTWSPNRGSTGLTFSAGNRTVQVTNSNAQTVAGSFSLTSGKWYIELDPSTEAYSILGILNINGTGGETPFNFGSTSRGYYQACELFGYYSHSGLLYTKGTGSAGVSQAYGASWDASNMIGIALDLDNGNLFFSKDGTWQNSASAAEIAAGNGTNAAATGLTNEYALVLFGAGSTEVMTIRNEADWSGTAPTGFVNMTQDNIASSDQFISAFSWIKNRDSTDEHMLFDRIRGVTNDLHIGSANQVTNVETLQSFLAGGVQVGNDVQVNTANESYVLWNFMMEATGSGASNEDGSINTVATLVDTTLGLSMSQFVGTGANATVGHGLGVVPEMVFVKGMDGGNHWYVYHIDRGTGYTFYWNGNSGGASTSTVWNNTAPTSSVFSLGTDTAVNGSSVNFVAYCFAPSQFTSFGSYEGNGNADGSFIPTVNSLGVPIQPVWAMMKSMDSTSDWYIYDNKRLGYNVENAQLWANLTTAEATADNLDIVTGGLKMRIATDPNVAETYVYMAIGTPIIDTDGRIIAGR